MDDGLSATGPLAVEKSDDFPTAQPFAHKLHSAPIICIEIILEDTRRANRVLALKLRRGRSPGYRYPAFQFEAAVREQMPQLLDVFGRGRAWQLYDFLMRAEPLLEGRLPLDLLRCGRAHDILRIAKLAATLEHGAH